MNKEDLEYTVQRIEYLEKIFDEVQSVFKNNPNFDKNEDFNKKVTLLTQYLESGQWLRDFTLDEKGELPKNLKRGILSEDGLYNLLCDIDNAKRKNDNLLMKLFKKDETLFAVLWIIVYVIGFGTADGLSESIGVPKLITVIFGAVFSAFLFIFAKKNDLTEYFGLCRTKIPAKDFLFFIPLAVTSTASIWGGISFDISPVHALLGVIAMCFVGFIEEFIFRGMLFTGMSKNGIKSAIIVSSLTFGVGHIVNLFMGAPVFDTLLQLVYTSAAGFCYTAVFYCGKSIIPCIISHAVINSLSVFGAVPSPEVQITISAVQSVINLGYGFWLFKKHKI
ncbi:MAG: DUF4298 domain-containing protein [Oscillospiraceae bacterium]|nr:DUF4298 domain-containing protein [Oscillospiraceae bacterium]